jgi:uncharacterized membrane protein YphA (DoxX/SURF4 family)
MHWLLDLLASIPLWYVAALVAYVIGSIIIFGLTWPFRHLPPTSPWYINEEGFQFRFNVVISAVAIGLAILKMLAPSLSGWSDHWTDLW